MTKPFETKRPILMSVLYTVLVLVFPVIAGTIITIFSLGEVMSKLVQAGCFALAVVVVYIIIKRKANSLYNVGFQRPAAKSAGKAILYIPLLAVEVLPLIYGFEEGLSLPLLVAALLVTICVGLAEELYFRGLILKTIRQENLWLAIILSSVLFGVGHLSNLAAGASVGGTILQVIFAFFFGLVAAEISILTESIFIPIIWHTVHNFISFTSATWPKTSELILFAVQCVVLLGYGIYLWKAIRRNSI
ncbi:MAG: lysostaphin resistance A-like protein [Lachnospiraceae bacterium]